MISLAGSTSAKTPMFVLEQGNSAHSSVRRCAGAEKCRPRASRCLAFRKLENRNYSRQFSSHLGSAGLRVPLLGNCDAVDAGKPAGVTPGR
jgi:hypothetical protein